MMPGNVLSSKLVYGGFLPPDDLPDDPLVDYEMGGVGISDASTGLLVQVWTAALHGEPGEAGTSVWLSASNTPETQLFQMDGITEISLAFDQNMHPFIAFVAAGVAQFYWYDATVPAYKFTELPEGSTSPKCTLDDKRPMGTLTAESDILVGYILEDTLYIRMQRDRYDTQYPLLADLSTKLFNPVLVKVAMSKVERCQFMLKGSLFS